MKSNGGKKQVNQIPCGNFVAAVFAAWGKRRGPRMVQWAVNSRLIQFLGEQRFVISGK